MDKEEKLFIDQHKVVNKKALRIFSILGIVAVLGGSLTAGHFIYKSSIAEKEKYIEPHADAIEIEEEADLGGRSYVEIQLSEMPKDKVVHVDLINDENNIEKVTLSSITNSKDMTVDKNRKLNIVVEFENEEINKNVESKYTLTFTYVDQNGKTKISKSETLTIKYIYGDPTIDDIGKFKPSYEILPKQELTETEAQKKFSEAVIANPDLLKEAITEKFMYGTVSSAKFSKIDYKSYYSLKDLELAQEAQIDDPGEGEEKVVYHMVKCEKFDIGFNNFTVTSHTLDSGFKIPLVSFNGKVYIEILGGLGLIVQDIVIDFAFNNIPYTVIYSDTLYKSFESGIELLGNYHPCDPKTSTTNWLIQPATGLISEIEDSGAIVKTTSKIKILFSDFKEESTIDTDFSNDAFISPAKFLQNVTHKAE